MAAAAGQPTQSATAAHPKQPDQRKAFPCSKLSSNTSSNSNGTSISNRTKLRAIAVVPAAAEQPKQQQQQRHVLCREKNAAPAPARCSNHHLVPEGAPCATPRGSTLSGPQLNLQIYS